MTGERTGADMSDAEWLETLRLMWTEHDPVPADLADRVSVALATVDLDAELLELVEGLLSTAGARGEDRTRTVTFSSETVSVMVTIDAGPGGARLDGWIADGGGLRVELRTGQPTGTVSRDVVTDEDGRFAFERVPAGVVRLVVHPTDGAALLLARPVTTPGVEI
jgi:hypothetical protein